MAVITLMLSGCTNLETANTKKENNTIAVSSSKLVIDNIYNMDAYQCLEALDNIAKILSSKYDTTVVNNNNYHYTQKDIDLLKIKRRMIFSRYLIVTGAPWENKENWKNGEYIGPVWVYDGKTYPGYK